MIRRALASRSRLLIGLVFGGWVVTIHSPAAAQTPQLYEDYGSGYSQSTEFEVFSSLGAVEPPVEQSAATEPSETSTDTPATSRNSPGSSSAAGGSSQAVFTRTLLADSGPAIAGLVIGVTALGALFTIIANLPLATPLAHLLSQLGVLLGWPKRRKPWGRVIDRATGRGVAGVVVRIYDAEFEKLLESQLTDGNGHFAIYVKSGQYYLEIEKAGYRFPAEEPGTDYHGETVRIRQAQALRLVVPIDELSDQVAKRVHVLQSIGLGLDRVRLPLMVMGASVELWLALTLGRPLDWVLLAVYGGLFLGELVGARDRAAIGRVVTPRQEPVALALVRSFAEPTGRLVRTRASDPAGRFLMTLPPGDYRLTATKSGFKTATAKVRLPKSGVVRKQLVLTPIKAERPSMAPDPTAA